jgi:type III restriction enzyme
MPPVTIENPILNSPFKEPTRHFRFTDEGITDETVESRSISTYFMPILRPRKMGKQQMEIDSDWLESRVEENILINQIRARVNLWRKSNHPGITPITRQLLAHWYATARARPLFFCQIEALETAIYLSEVAPKSADTWIENDLKKANASCNPGLFRIAIKRKFGNSGQYTQTQYPQEQTPSSSAFLLNTSKLHRKAPIFASS